MYEMPGVVGITPGSIYVLTREALDEVLDELLDAGYKIDGSIVTPDKYVDKGIHPKGIWHSWFAHLDPERKAICGSCNARISVGGVFSHGHKCEACGEVTYWDFTQGTTMRFYFINDARETSRFDPHLKMKIYGYDEEAGMLLLYAEPIDGNNFNDWNAENAKKVLEANEHQITRRKAEDGTDLIAIKHDPYDRKVSPDQVIMPCDYFPDYRNAKVIKILRGVEYDEYARLPLQEYVHVYEAWHWAPKSGPSDTLHSDIIYAAGLVSRCDYYYQDGRTAVYPEHLERMRKYVANLTTIDIDQWDQAMRRAPRDGPGFIRYLASLCQGVPISEVKVVDEPNIGNVIEGMSKVMSGQRLTQGEMRAMRRGMQDTEIRSTAINLWGNALTAGSRKA